MSRSGVVAGMTVKDLLKANEQIVNGKKQYSLRIVDHKTAIDKGTTYPSLSFELYMLLMKYLEECRPFLVTDSDKENDLRPVFVSANGEPFDSSSTGRRVVDLGLKGSLHQLYFEKHRPQW